MRKILEWLAKTYWLLPNFSWLGIALTLIILAVCIVLILRYRRKHKGEEDTIPEEEKAEPTIQTAAAEPVPEPIEAKSEAAVADATADAAKEATAKAPLCGAAEETPKTEAAAAAEATKVAANEPVREDKKVNQTESRSHIIKEDKNDVSAKAVVKRLKEEKTMDKKPSVDKIYHISKRKEDNRWQVKAEGAAKAVKLFFTQAEAIEYAKSVAGNQDGRIVIHKEDGSFRKLTY